MQGLMEKIEEGGFIWRVPVGKVPKYHARLTSGNCSDAFVNISRLSEEPRLLAEVCEELVGRLGWNNKTVDRVLGPAVGAITIAHEVAKRINRKTGYFEKDETKLVLSRFGVGRHERAGLVDDVFTSGSSLSKMVAELYNLRHSLEGGNPLDGVDHNFGVIINRSGQESIELAFPHGSEVFKIVSVLDVVASAFYPEECPYCRLGSEPMKPKANWDLFLNGNPVIGDLP